MGDAGRPERANAPTVAPTVQVGARLRGARQARRMTLDDVASASGVTKGFLSRVERNQASASVATLLQVCAVLELSVGELFDTDVDARPLRKDDYPPIYLGGEGLHEFLLTPSFEQRLQVIHSVIDPGGGSGNEPYALPSNVEFAYLLEGTLEIVLDSEVVILRTGDALTFSAQTKHNFRNSSETEQARVMWVLAPALPRNGRRHGEDHEHP